MKTFNDCKEEVAKKHGYKSVDHFLTKWLYNSTMDFEKLQGLLFDEAAELYATEVAKAQREALKRRFIEYASFPVEFNKLIYMIQDTPLVTDKPG